jgi:hypothetical protein
LKNLKGTRHICSIVAQLLRARHHLCVVVLGRITKERAAPE